MNKYLKKYQGGSNIDPRYIEFLKKHEGFSPTVYWDKASTSKYKNTIGYGTSFIKGNPIDKNMTVTEEQATNLIYNFFDDNEKIYKNIFKKWDQYPDQVKNALRDITYNGGPENYSTKSPKFVKAINDGYEDDILTEEEYKRIIKELEVDNTSGEHKDRKERRAAMLGNMYNYDDNANINKAGSGLSPYTGFHTNIFTSVIKNPFKPIILNKPKEKTPLEQIIGNNTFIVDKNILDTSNLGPYIINSNKSGGSIHIKKANRGKFTDYCGGKVTSECIQKGKNSPDPKIRKRATFAANARKWKHQDGGIFERLEVYISKNQNGGLLNDPTEIKGGKFFKASVGVNPLEVSTQVEKPIEENTTKSNESISNISDGYENFHLIENTQSTSFTNSYSDFSNKMFTAYKNEGLSDDLAKVLTFQDILETAGGKKVVGDYNYGNITTGSSWNGKSKQAKDNSNGKIYTFRSYNSEDEYIKDKLDILRRNYDITDNDSAEIAIAKLTGNNKKGYRYAEDPDYANKLRKGSQSLS